jgi:tetratricopeptide (TPR) repeat protein
LSEPDVGEFIEARLGRSLDAGARASTARRWSPSVHRATGGNPFFVREIVRLLAAEGKEEASVDDFEIPTQVREAIHRRLAPLRNETRQLLRVAAVIGKEFDVAVLQRTCSATLARVLDAIDETVRHNLLSPHSGERDHYSFAHSLVRDVLYDDLPSAERGRMHHRVGEALEAVHETSLQSCLFELAHHFSRALPEGDQSKALDYLVRAAEMAVQQMAYEDAVAMYSKALQIAKTAQNFSEHRRRALLLALGNSCARAGDAGAARGMFRRAIDLAEQVSDAETLAHAALGYSQVSVGVPGAGSDSSTGQLLERALAVTSNEDNPVRSRLLSRLAVELLIDPTSEAQRASLSQEAVDMAERMRNHGARAYALHSRHLAVWHPNNAGDRLAIATEMLRSAEAAGDAELTFQARVWRILDCWELGYAAALDQEIRACVEMANSLCQPRFQWIALYLQAVRASSRGDLPETRRLAEEALRLGERIKDQSCPAFLRTLQFGIHILSGRLAEFENTLIVHLERHGRGLPAATRVALALVDAQLNRREKAKLGFEEVAKNGFADLTPFSWLVEVSLLAQTCSYLNDVKRARLLYDLLLPYERRNALVGRPSTFYFGPAAHYLGILATTLSRCEAAEAHFETALQMEAEMGARPHMALTRYEYARMLFGQPNADQRGRAPALLGEALREAQEMGMQGLVEKARALMAGEEYAQGVRERELAKSGRLRVAVFRLDRDYWTIGDPPQLMRLKSTKGLEYMHYLLSHPGYEFHVLQLTRLVTPALGQHPFKSPSREDLSSMSLQGDIGPLFDHQATAAYRSRLIDLRDEIEQAKEHNDLGRAEKLQAEMDFLTHELAMAVGLSGRRTAGSVAERARVNVTKLITTAKKQIRDGNPALGRYLAKTIKTGTFCSYQPDPDVPIRWQL